MFSTSLGVGADICCESSVTIYGINRYAPLRDVKHTLCDLSLPPPSTKETTERNGKAVPPPNFQSSQVVPCIVLIPRASTPGPSTLCPPCPLSNVPAAAYTAPAMLLSSLQPALPRLNAPSTGRRSPRHQSAFPRQERMERLCDPRNCFPASFLCQRPDA